MILVDDRLGSRDQIERLERAGLSPVEMRLDAGDFAVLGQGPGGEPFTVGLELKRLSDLLGVVKDGRFAGSQLPLMRGTYTLCYLIVEGEYRKGEGGAIEVPRRGGWETPKWARAIGYAGLQSWLFSLALKGGARLAETDNERQTTEFLAGLNAWLEEGWDAHRSMDALDRSYRVQDEKIEQWVESSARRAGRATQFAKELPGLGDDKARAAAQHFRTGRRMANATAAEWLEVPGVGKKLARACFEAWDEEEG